MRFGATGEPSVLRLDEVPEPRAPRRDELLVRVTASSINGTDLGLRRGDVPVAVLGRLPYVPGFDLCGEVEACGPAVSAFSPGDRIVALLSHAGGGQAERVLVRQDRAALAPRTVGDAEAAALPLAGLTALQALYARARLRAYAPGAGVLVLGAAGGIGSYAVQLATLADAHVTGVASGPKLDYVTGLGADAVLDYRATALPELDARWQVVLDTTGRYSFVDLARILTPDGVLVSTRPISRDALRRLRPSRFGGPRFTFVATKPRSQDLAHLANLVETGRLRVPLDRVFPAGQAAAAHRHAEGEVRGKVVLTLA